MRYLLTFSYDGSKFHGFQRQKNVKNVQGALEVALSNLLGEEIEIKGSGRTDAGVHALMQTAHFDISKKLDKDFKDKLNDVLKEEIVVKKIKPVSEDFHARFSIKKKQYRYLINLDKAKINEAYTFTSFVPLDVKRMKKASKLFVGTHDFQNFVSGPRDDYMTYIYKINIKRKKNLLIIDFVGTGFYRYMVRHLVGALYDVGRGKVDASVIQEMLDFPRFHKQLTVMPANGLYLVKIRY